NASIGAMPDARRAGSQLAASTAAAPTITAGGGTASVSGHRVGLVRSSVALASPSASGDTRVIQTVIRNVMSLVSIRLPDDVEARLADEAERAGRPKSEIARDAIIDYLERLERERFLADIARAARERDGREVVAGTEEALPLDNEALDIAEG